VTDSLGRGEGDHPETGRRQFLQRVGALAASSTAVLAGCRGDPDDDGDDTYVPNEPNYQGWFENVSNYRGTVEARGQSDYEIRVGVQGANGYYYYGPAAVAVSPSTTVTWVWTGRGGTHNCVSTSGAFTSGRLVDEAGHTFTHTFDNPGIYRYYCSPHQSLGMKGAVFVALGQPGEQS
jgi:halocyanin-like protein